MFFYSLNSDRTVMRFVLPFTAGLMLLLVVKVITYNEIGAWHYWNDLFLFAVFLPLYIWLVWKIARLIASESEWIGLTFVLVVLLALLAMTLRSAKGYAQDLPDALCGTYPIDQGICSHRKVAGRSKHTRVEFEIDGQKHHLSKRFGHLVEQDKAYRIAYLPATGYIVSLVPLQAQIPAR